jgi:hypothetical protein
MYLCYSPSERKSNGIDSVETKRCCAIRKYVGKGREDHIRKTKKQGRAKRYARQNAREGARANEEEDEQGENEGE